MNIEFNCVVFVIFACIASNALCSVSSQCFGNIFNSNPFRILSMHSYPIWYLAYLSYEYMINGQWKRVSQWTHNAFPQPKTLKIKNQFANLSGVWLNLKFKYCFILSRHYENFVFYAHRFRYVLFRFVPFRFFGSLYYYYYEWIYVNL